jgi:lipopolysaccharide transport system permease protein
MSDRQLLFNTDLSSTEFPWTKVITARGSWFDLRLRETWQYRELVLLLLYRNVLQTSRQTVLGPVWWLIQPLLLCFVYMFLFVVVARVPMDGIPPIPFLLSGLTLWMFFNNVFNAAMGLFSTSMSICGKVYVPRMVVYLAGVFYASIQYAVQLLLLMCCVAYYSYSIPQISFRFSMLLTILIIPYVVILGTGTGLILASLAYRYRDIQLMVAPAMRILRYGSAVLFPVSALPDEYKLLLLWNPMVPVIEAFRWSLFGVGMIDPLYITMSVLITFICLVVGIVRFSIVNRVCMDAL